MKNIKQLQEKYSKYSNGLGHISWGSKQYYEINSDIGLNLNQFTGGFITNEKGEVEIYEFIPDHERVFYYKHFDGRKITSDEYYQIMEETNWENELDDSWEFIDCDITIKYWGKTLDNYFPYPYYPDKEILGFTIMKEIPLFDLDEYCKINDGMIYSVEDNKVGYSIEQCLNLPEFFKPNYLN